MFRPSCSLLVLGALALLAPAACGQGAVAFQPIPGVIPEGQTLTVTPVATADRRYVRLSVNPVFIGFVDFQTFPVPAAVGGSGIGGGLGGLGGVLGGFGGGLGGGGGAVGGNAVVGMDGLVDPRTGFSAYLLKPAPSGVASDPLAVVAPPNPSPPVVARTPTPAAHRRQRIIRRRAAAGAQAQNAQRPLIEKAPTPKSAR
jgi:hypothetical protein